MPGLASTSSAELDGNSEVSASSDEESIDGSESSVEMDLTDDSRGLSRLHDRVTSTSCKYKPRKVDDALVEAVGKISLYLCQETYVDSNSSSTLLVYFSGILGFTASGSAFERPRNYTPKLSGLIYCVRLCVLEASLPRFAYPSNGWQARPRIGSLKRLNRARVRYMCYGCQAPMGELLSLRSYGRAFSRSDGPRFRVNWSDDSQTVSWNDGKISMPQFRMLGARIHESASTSMSRLMYGLDPQLCLKGMRDDFANVEHAYSFVEDKANDLRSRYLDLSSRACLDPIDGLMHGDQWRYDAVHRYLAEESKFLLLIFQLLFLRAGQGPRTSELSSIECYNGPSTARGLYVHDGALVYVTRHSKARKSTNKEFHVARYLCHGDSSLLAKYLVYVRPFTDMLRRKCHGYRQERRLLFADATTPERPWKADILTRALKTLSKEVCGAAFGVQIYRQLSIAVTERHIKDICRPFDRNDDQTANADVEVAFAWQSGHRPVQRGTTYGIYAAYPDSLQPALLRVYRWVSSEWHRFLDLNESLEPRSPTQRREPVMAKRSLEQATWDRPSKRLQSSSTSSTTISPQPTRQRNNRPRQTSAGFLNQLLGIESVNDEGGDVDTNVLEPGRESLSTTVRVERAADTYDELSQTCFSSPGDSPHGTNDTNTPHSHYEDVSLHSLGAQALDYGFRGRVLDLGDLVRSPAVGITHYGHVPTFATCKDALDALRCLPGEIKSRIGEIQIPDQLTATDDCDNVRYAEELGQYLVEEAAHVEIITLPVPNDLLAGSGGDQGQYEFRSWELHEAVIDAFKTHKFTELRFAHPEDYPEERPAFEVYQMHNADKYIKRMLIGRAQDDLLWTKSLRLIRSRRYPQPPSPADDRDTLFAVLHAINYDAWTAAGYSLAFTQRHKWEAGSVLALRRTPNKVRAFWKQCESAARWWLDKCPFCIGNGLHGSNIMHAFETCHRGGLEERKWNVGGQILGSNVRVSKGCGGCAFPEYVCAGPNLRRMGACPSSPRRCRFGGMVYDVVIAMCQSECYLYREMLAVEISLEKESDPSDHELAVWLSRPMPGKEDIATQILRIFLMWTRAAQEQLDKRTVRIDPLELGLETRV